MNELLIVDGVTIFEDDDRTGFWLKVGVRVEFMSRAQARQLRKLLDKGLKQKPVPRTKRQRS